MKILVTGSNGFIGKNLICELKNRQYTDIYTYDITSAESVLDSYTKDCDFVFHLAGINRPQNPDEFKTGNTGFTNELLGNLKKNGNRCPVLITSSIQAELDNPYGRSKKEAENLLFSYEKETGAPVFVYRLPNVFGKWCRPNYNSAVATFCNNIANGLPIQVNDPDVLLRLVYIDDVVTEFVNALEGKALQENGFCFIPSIHTVRLGEIVSLIQSFKQNRIDFMLPDVSDSFAKKLYSAYLSYLPNDQFSYPLTMHVDARGSFTEFIRTEDRGQVSVNISKPGIAKGNHWHHTKTEKFLVVKGQGVINFRKIDSDEIISYPVNGDRLEVIDIPPGYTHNIINTGDQDMVTVMWANEAFNPEKPDTYYLEV